MARSALAVVLAVVVAAAFLASAQELPVYKVVVEVETKSDWTRVSIEGFTAPSYRVVEGAGRPTSG